MANFDAITYVKGQSTLRQLVAYVGEEAFVEGLRAYFRDHAWGNTRLDDLMSAVGGAADHDLSDWTTAWFDREGTDTLTLTDDAILATSAVEGEEPRPHRLDIGSYVARDGVLERVGMTPVEVEGVRTPVPDLPQADLHLPNDGDLTFAAVRTDERSLRTLLASAGGLPDPLGRALAVSTAWDMLAKGELSSDEFLTCVLGVLGTERTPGVVEPFLALALRAADLWTPTVSVPGQLARLAGAAAALADHPDLSSPALRTLAASAREEEHFQLLDRAGADDVDLAWRVLVRRAALGDHDPAAVEALVERDPDPEAWVRALSVTAARDDEDAKAEVWKHLFEKRSVPAGQPMIIVAQAFWRPTQHDVLLPWAHRYLDELEQLPSVGLLAAAGLIQVTFPSVGDQAFLDRGRAMAAEPGQDPTVRTTLLKGTDTLARMLRARGCSAAVG